MLLLTMPNKTLARDKNGSDEQRDRISASPRGSYA
jgi:hypothetical protein